VNRQRVEQIALVLIAGIMLPAGLQAAFTPRVFFDDFPLGRSWIEQEGGAYNEHLVRDVGALILALIIVTVWTLRRPAARAVAAAWFVQGSVHLAYHVGHLDGYNTADRRGLIGSLVAVPLLALVALWAGWSPRSPADD
jgi:hypothetical protein